MPGGTIQLKAPVPPQTIVTFSVTVPIGNGNPVGNPVGVVSIMNTESRITTEFETADHLKSCPCPRTEGSFDPRGPGIALSLSKTWSSWSVSPSGAGKAF